MTRELGHEISVYCLTAWITAALAARTVCPRTARRTRTDRKSPELRQLDTSSAMHHLKLVSLVARRDCTRQFRTV